MKQIYEAPATTLVVIETQQMMAASGLQTDGSGNPYQDLGDAPTTTETSGNLSRHRSLWDDDED